MRCPSACPNPAYPVPRSPDAPLASRLFEKDAEQEESLEVGTLPLPRVLSASVAA